MNYFVILTDECNLNCRYCRGKNCLEEADDDYDFLPVEIEYDIRNLADLCSKDPDCGILFYGGEPLLRIGRIMQIMDAVPAKTFILQTNSFGLENLPAKYMKRLDGLQISIDGNRKTTDFYRGNGVYDTCIMNAGLARQSGFSGELIARMTAAENTDIFRDVTHLLGTGLFDAVHWQLDALFAPDYEKRDFLKWAEKSYNPGITRLADLWIKRMNEGRVLRLYPFLGIMTSLLKWESTGLRCGAGHAHYVIQTDGRIVPCPAMMGMKSYYAGDLSTNPSKLKKFHVGEPCTKCGIMQLCGGRCLYANIHKFWGREGFDAVCMTVRHLIREMQRILPEVRELISSGIIAFDDLNYTRFNSCEIIP